MESHNPSVLSLSSIIKIARRQIYKYESYTCILKIIHRKTSVVTPFCAGLVVRTPSSLLGLKVLNLIEAKAA